MTSHGGTRFFDDRPLERCAAATYSAPGIIMAQPSGGVWTGHPSAPVRTASGLVATWDGRLDNRDDVLASLGSPALRSTCDGEIAAAVFERWSVTGLRLLVGDWSLVIWDGTRRTLHLARDYMGARPLYYAARADSVAWSGTLGELVERTARVDTLSDGFAASFMSLQLSPEITPYEGVHAVPTGTCISIGPFGSTTRTRFWTLEPGEIRHADPRTYEEQLRALWREAVQVRLRTHETAWGEISGGLDSSSVVCMAHLLMNARVVSSPGIRLVSHATVRSPEGDERRFIAEVERQVSVTSEIVAVEDHQEHTDPDLAWVTPYAVQGVGLETVRRIRAAGGRLVLSGRLGDAIMGCQPDNSVAVFDDLARGALIRALRNMRCWSRATRKPFVEIAWRLFAPASHTAADADLTLLTPRLQALVPRPLPADEPMQVRRAKRDVARMVLGYALGARLDVPHHSPDIVYTYPFTHRPLVEFMLAIPGEQLSAPGDTRSLMRRAFSSFVPARILRRVSKGYYPPAAFRAARRLVASLLPVGELEVVRRGWIDPERLKQAIRTLTDGGGDSGGEIHSVLRLERWLHEHRRKSAIPRREEVKTNEVLHT